MRRLSEEEKIERLKDYTQYTWQLVRRNHNYIIDYQYWKNNAQEEAKKKGGANPFLWDVDMMKKLISKWGFVQDPEDERLNEQLSRQIVFFGEQALKGAKDHFLEEGQYRRFSLFCLFLASMKLPGVIGINDLPGVKLQKVENGTGQFKISKDKKVSLIIDLDAPTWLIITSMQMIINALRSGLEISEKRIPWDMMDIYLKLYDLDMAGKSLEEIAKEIYPVEFKKAGEDGSIDSLIRKLRNNRDRAKEMVKAGKIIMED